MACQPIRRLTTAMATDQLIQRRPIQMDRRMVLKPTPAAVHPSIRHRATAMVRHRTSRSETAAAHHLIRQRGTVPLRRLVPGSATARRRMTEAAMAVDLRLIREPARATDRQRTRATETARRRTPALATAHRLIRARVLVLPTECLQAIHARWATATPAAATTAMPAAKATQEIRLRRRRRLRLRLHRRLLPMEATATGRRPTREQATVRPTECHRGTRARWAMATHVAATTATAGTRGT
jgi:hypothetical protein